MVDFNTYISVGLEKCAPSGEGSQDARRETFAELVDIWHEEKDRIRQMSEVEVERELNCP